MTDSPDDASGLHRYPQYRAVREAPTRGFPPELLQMEQSPAFDRRAHEIRSDLRRPPDDQPAFIELLANGGRGVLTFKNADMRGEVLLVFTSALRVADYIQTHLGADSAFTYLSSSASELSLMLQDLRKRNVRAFALDRCPRCEAFTAFDTRNVTTANDVLNLWSVVKSIEFARADACVTYAESALNEGNFSAAREVLLEAIAHVSPEEPRFHFMLGQIAVATGDSELLREVKECLRFLKCASLEDDLDEMLEDAKSTGQPGGYVH